MANPWPIPFYIFWSWSIHSLHYTVFPFDIYKENCIFWWVWLLNNTLLRFPPSFSGLFGMRTLYECLPGQCLPLEIVRHPGILYSEASWHPLQHSLLLVGIIFQISTHTGCQEVAQLADNRGYLRSSWIWLLLPFPCHSPIGIRLV